jgi:hypothetical protein
VLKRREKLDPHPNLTCKNAFLMVGYVEVEAEVGGSGVEGMGGFKSSSMSSNTPGCMITIGSILRLGKMFHFSSPDPKNFIPKSMIRRRNSTFHNKNNLDSEPVAEPEPKLFQSRNRNRSRNCSTVNQ